MRLLTPLVLGAGLLAAPMARTDTYQRQPGVDVQHYRFAITLTDSTDEIRGEATVTIRFSRDGLNEFFLDLTSAAAGKGMTVTSVTAGGSALRFTHGKNQLRH